MTFSNDKKSAALNLARSKTLAGKLVWLVQSDRQDIPVVHVKIANVLPLEVRSNTVTRGQ